MSSVVDDYRAKILNEALQLVTVQKGFPIWHREMKSLTNNFTDPRKILDLGKNLSAIFALTSKKGTTEDDEKRGQKEVTDAGRSWEFLVFLYSNYVLSGTSGIVMRPVKSQVPSSVYSATTIGYHNERTNTESDLVGLTFPNDLDSRVLKATGLKTLDSFIEKNLGLVDLLIIQCKTNWRDNAQVPMLWDMIYKISRSKIDDGILSSAGISIGSDTTHIRDFRRFSYAFATVPTGDDDYKPSHMPVKRVLNLSGGNFWGKPFRKGVARPLSDMFQRNFAPAFALPILDSIEQAINQKRGLFGSL